ncbi:MAG: FMN-binding glutamate synthase family protein [Parvularculaceae bacterium]
MEAIVDGWVARGLGLLATGFLIVIGGLAAFAVAAFIADARQSRDAIRRNYPLIGRFRGLFIHLGDFFRQYFFALDREEMPFNRAEREWVGAAAAGMSDAQPFGSTRNLTIVGTPIFVNCPFPRLEDDAREPPPIAFGPDTPNPYLAGSIFNVSGMSYGSLSAPAIRALSAGAARAGCWLNTGEGGLSDHHLSGGADIVFQIGTAKYGVRGADGRLDDEKLGELARRPDVKMIEIKLAQGAKPGKGGILPAEKVTEEIARVRGIPVGEASISPNRHPEVDSVEDLLDFIDHVRSIAKLPTGIKTVMGAYGWVDDLCDAIERRGRHAAPDFITLDGGDGGTGASPMALMDNVGLPLRIALPTLTDILERRGLRNRVRIVASGKLVTPADVAWAMCAGADAVNCARGFMFSLGCIQAMRCHTNDCPSGVATHKARLQRGLDPALKAESVARYVERVRKDVAVIAHSCGVAHARALGRKHVRIVQASGDATPLDVLSSQMALARAHADAVS